MKRWHKKRMHNALNRTVDNDKKIGRLTPFLKILFFGVFAAMGTFIFIEMFGAPFYQSLKAREWATIPCTIESSQMDIHSNDEGYTYRLNIRYTYIHENKTYISDNYTFENPSSSIKSWKEKALKKYPKGSKHECYVNPVRPSEAVLYRGRTPDGFLALIPMVFMIIGFGGIVVSLRKWLPGLTRKPMPHDWNRELQHEGSLILKAKKGSWKKFFSILFFSLFWCGITSVFVAFAIKNWLNGDPEIFLTIFILPFVLIGVGSWFFVIRALLNTANPHPEITVNSKRIPVGEALILSWRMPSTSQHISHFRITLEGIEETRRRSGKNQQIQKNVFISLLLVDKQQRLDMQAGEVECWLPDDTMPTFSAPHNKIYWQLHIEGEIPHWPDIDETYEIEITPKKPHD